MKKSFFVKGIYGSGMVLQQNTKNCIFGGGAVAPVELSFSENKYSVLPDSKGEWKLEFDTAAAGGPYIMTLTSGEEKIEYSDVYVGEVWVNSGQSNAQLTMVRLQYSYPEEFMLPENPQIRIITIPISYAFNGEKDTVKNPEWKSASPQNMAELSGTAYFFAKKLQEELKVPVGIINASQGGSPVYSWMNEEAFAKLGRKDYLDRIKKWNKKGAVTTKSQEVLAAQQKWDSELIQNDKGIINQWEQPSLSIDWKKEWKNFKIPGDFTELGEDGGVVWFKKDFNLTAKEAEKLNSAKTRIWFGTIQDADKIWVNESFCGVTYYTYPPRRYEIPTGTLHEGINTVTVRVQKNGIGPIRFYEEKNYCIFTDDIKVHPVAYRNVEKPLKNNICAIEGIKIDLSGEWKYCIACRTSARPGEMFFEWEPAALFNAMLSPCFNYAVKGALWYQGESNALEAESYKPLLKEMIALWRRKFVYASKNMPFIIMQLPNWADGYKDETKQNFGDWAMMRYAEVSAVEETDNTALVSMIDAGEWNDLHPEKKKTGGTRAAKEALRLVYAKSYNFAPKMEYCERKNKIFTVKFNCGNSELKAYEVTDESADFEKESNIVYGFEFLLENNSKVNAEAKLISKNAVEIYVPQNTKKLIELRYLWANNPWVVNLYSTEGLPAIPFKVML